MPDLILIPGQIWSHNFVFSQKEVEEFASVTGDRNPIHLDKEYAAKTAMKSPVVHGMMGASVFSTVFGTIFPGPGTLYLNQTLNFLIPLRVEKPYEARFTVLEEVARKRFRIRTQIIDNQSEEIAIEGEAIIRLTNMAG